MSLRSTKSCCPVCTPVSTTALWSKAQAAILQYSGTDSKLSQKSKFICVYPHKLYLCSPFRGHLKVLFHFETVCESAFLHMTIYLYVSHSAYSEHQLYNPTDLPSHLHSRFKLAAEAQSISRSQYAPLASFGFLCSNTSLHWLSKQAVLHSTDYVSPTSCNIPFLVLLGTDVYFFYFCIISPTHLFFILKHECQQ